MRSLNQLAAGSVLAVVLAALFIGHDAPVPVVTALPAAEPLIAIESPVTPLIPAPPGPEKPDVPPRTDSAVATPPSHPPADAESPAPATEPAPADPNAAVQLIEVYHPGGADAGSAVHIGGGTFLTCRHVCTDDRNRPLDVRFIRIAGRRVSSETPVLHATLDVALIRTSKTDLPSVDVSTARPVPGDPLTVIGVKTDRHDGQVSKRLWRPSMGLEASTMTENGDSGAGVFDSAGRLVGIQHGSARGTIFFTPLADVAALLDAPQSPAAIGPHPPSAPPAADSGAKPVVYVDVPEGDWCAVCNGLKNLDQSKLEYRMEFREVRDDRHPYFPHVHVVNRSGQEVCAQALGSLEEITAAWQRLY